MSFDGLQLRPKHPQGEPVLLWPILRELILRRYAKTADERDCNCGVQSTVLQ